MSRAVAGEGAGVALHTGPRSKGTHVRDKNLNFDYLQHASSAKPFFISHPVLLLVPGPH